MSKKPGRPGVGKERLVTIRLTPKMRFAVELLARKQRRPSITAVIEFAIERLLHDKASGMIISDGEEGVSFLPDLVWDEDDVSRFVKLCLHCSALLTYDEELIWRVIESDKSYWKEFRIPDYEKIKAEWGKISNKAEEARTFF